MSDVDGEPILILGFPDPEQLRVPYAMKIPYDILFEVFKIQEAHGDLLGISLMGRTCRELRNEAAKHLLSHPITLRNARDVVSFSLFMQADEGNRFHLLRHSLAIETGPLSENAAITLVLLVDRISHLERLILRDADKILDSDTRLPRAFAAMTCLKHLDFFMSQDPESRESCVYMLTRMRSRLVTASLHSSVTIHHGEGQISNGLLDPIGLFRRSASTLTEVRGTWLWARKHRTIYPNVKILRILLHLGPDITPYIVAYPNLTSLDVRCGPAMDEDTLRDIVWRNQEGQQSTGCWRKLKRLEGRSQDLYAIALQCRVETLIVHASRRYQAGELLLLTDVLSRARPAYLRLEVDSSAVVSDTDGSLEDVLSRSGASSFIRSLTLRIMTDLDSDMHQLLVRASMLVHCSNTDCFHFSRILSGQYTNFR